MNLLLTILNDFQSANRLIGVYTDEVDTCKFDIGWIIDTNEENFALLSIDEHGEYDQTIIGLIEDINRLSYGTQYITALTERASFDNCLSKLDFTRIKASIYRTVESAMNLGFLVRFVDKNWEVTIGHPLRQDNEFIELNTVDEEGGPSGTEVIRHTNLRRLEIFGLGTGLTKVN